MALCKVTKDDALFGKELSHTFAVPLLCSPGCQPILLFSTLFSMSFPPHFVVWHLLNFPGVPSHPRRHSAVTLLPWRKKKAKRRGEGNGYQACINHLSCWYVLSMEKNFVVFLLLLFLNTTTVWRAEAQSLQEQIHFTLKKAKGNKRRRKQK